MTSLVTGATLAGYVFTLFRERATARAYGAGLELDAFLVASAITSFGALTLARALYDSLVPATAGLRAEDEGAAAALARTVLSLTAAALIAAALGVALARDRLVAVVAPAMAPGGADLAIGIVLALSPSIVFVGVSEVSRALLHGYQEFVIPALLPVAGTGVVLLFLVLLAEPLGIGALVAGTLAASAVQLGLAAAALARRGVFAETRLAGRTTLAPLMAPFAVGILLSGVGTLSPIIDRVLGSYLPEGRIAALSYALRITDVAAIGAASGLATVIYPRLALHRRAGSTEQLVRDVRLATLATLAAALAAGALLVLLARPLVAVILGTGRFDLEAQRATSESLAVYALALPFIAPSYILGRALYVLRRIEALIIQGGLFLLVKATVGFLLLGSLGHIGVALAHVGGNAAGTITMLVALVLALRMERRGTSGTLGT